MDSNKGKIIVIEGTDGSGKQTQTETLYKRLKREGHKVKLISFPSYGTVCAGPVVMYLNGEFGDNANDVDSYIASTFYALDRYASFKTEWEKYYNDGYILIMDRYSTSNAVFQAAKLPENEKEKFLDWLWDYEHNLYKIPKPDKVLFLNVHPNDAERLIKGRVNKFSGDKQKDIHERDADYLNKSYQNALYVADKYNWERIECVLNGEFKSIEDINNQIYRKIKTFLPKKDH